MIIPRHIFEEYNGANALSAPANLQPVGTGPYMVDSFKPQEVLLLGNEIVETNKIVYVINPYYRDEDKPYFSRVELRGGGTVKEAARSVLQVGDVDFAYNLQVDADVLAEMEAAGNGQILSPFGSFVERILLNRSDPNQATDDGERSSVQFPHPILSDPNVRQAINYAINRDAIAALYGPQGRPASNVLVSPGNYYSENTSYEFNLDKAAALLDEAGWIDSNGDGIRDKDGEKLSFVFQTSSNSIRQQTQRIVQDALASIGVDVEVKIIDSSVFFSNNPDNTNTRFHFYADLEEFNTGNRSPDPGPYMKNWVCDDYANIPQKSNNWSGLNIERWCSADYDALYEQSTRELDPERREQLFIQMNDMLLEDVVVIPLVHRADVYGVNNSLENIELSPWDFPTWMIEDWRRTSP
jgi:peptide/nickel transport system substrate-binding protein